jgi:chromatin remodeling complex protein RSC6
MGREICFRTDVSKEVWVYIKANDLQNPLKKREIVCDETLLKLLKKPRVDMFKMTGILSLVSENIYIYTNYTCMHLYNKYTKI